MVVHRIRLDVERSKDDEQQETGNQVVEQVPEQRRRPENNPVSAAHQLTVLRFTGTFSNQKH